MAGLKIRAALASDAEQLTTLRRLIVRDPFITFTTVEPTIDETIREIETADHNKIPFLVADLGSGPVGFATWKQFRAGPGYAKTVEHTVHIDPSARGSGLGRALLEALLNCARKAGINVVVAGVSSANTPGLEFHKRIGFRQVGRMPGVGRKNGKCFDLVLMQIDLCPDIPDKDG